MDTRSLGLTAATLILLAGALAPYRAEAMGPGSGLRGAGAGINLSSQVRHCVYWDPYYGYYQPCGGIYGGVVPLWAFNRHHGHGGFHGAFGHGGFGHGGFGHGGGGHGGFGHGGFGHGGGHGGHHG